MKKSKKKEDIVQQIRERAELMNDEYGEMAILMVELSEYCSMMDEKFYTAFIKELKNIHENFMEESTIIEYEDTVTVKRRELQWS